MQYTVPKILPGFILDVYLGINFCRTRCPSFWLQCRVFISNLHIYSWTHSHSIFGKGVDGNTHWICPSQPIYIFISFLEKVWRGNTQWICPSQPIFYLQSGWSAEPAFMKDIAFAFLNLGAVPGSLLAARIADSVGISVLFLLHSIIYYFNVLLTNRPSTGYVVFLRAFSLWNISNGHQCQLIHMYVVFIQFELFTPQLKVYYISLSWQYFVWVDLCVVSVSAPFQVLWPSCVWINTFFSCFIFELRGLILQAHLPSNFTVNV